MCLPRGGDVTQMVLDMFAFVRENLRHRSSPEPAAGCIPESHVASHGAASGAQHTGDMRAEGFEQLESRLDGRPIVSKPPHPGGVRRHPGPIIRTAWLAQRREHDVRRHEIRFHQVVSRFPDRPTLGSAPQVQISRREARDGSPDPARRRGPRSQGRRLTRRTLHDVWLLQRRMPRATELFDMSEMPGGVEEAPAITRWPQGNSPLCSRRPRRVRGCPLRSTARKKRITGAGKSWTSAAAKQARGADGPLRFRCATNSFAPACQRYSPHPSGPLRH